MDELQAKKQLLDFLNERELTFNIRRFDNGEWIAECNEIGSIITGGMGEDITAMDTMIRDAILTAAGIDTQYANKILIFKGLKSSILNFLTNDKKKEAEYAVD